MKQLGESYTIDRSRVPHQDVEHEANAVGAGRWQYPFSVHNWRVLVRLRPLMREQGYKMRIWTELQHDRIVVVLQNGRPSRRR